MAALNMAKAGARALWTLSDSKHNMEHMRKCGIVPLMARLLKSVHIEVVIPIMGTIQKCASQVSYYHFQVSYAFVIFLIAVQISTGYYHTRNDCRHCESFAFNKP